MSEIKVRPADINDARGILEAHYSAVHETASRDYPVQILHEWSGPVTPERIEWYRTRSFPNETTLVAEVDGKIAGFGAIVESISELRAVYVSAEFGNRGVGTALLERLETLAREKGCTELHMDSSLTAAGFYRRHGFIEVSRGEHTLRLGSKMACVQMRKALLTQG
jgi:N-acetylglutamate synthase-like GNAT family acetyltransferase